MKRLNFTSVSILTSLTDDLLLIILDKLQEDADRKTWRLVCTDFLRLESLHRKSLRVLRHVALPALLRRYSSLERLDLSVCPRVDDQVLAFSFVRPGWAWGLRSLILCRATAVRFGGLEAAVKACPTLEVVDVSYCSKFGDREAAALSCATGLRDLRLVKCWDITDVGLAKIAVGCQRLEKLNLKWCLEISDLGLDLLSKKCHDLKFLDVSYLKISNKSLESLSSLRNLKSLLMVGCSNLDDEGMNFLKNGNASLQCIDISRCEKVTPYGLASVIEGHLRLYQITARHSVPELSALFLVNLKELENLRSIRLDGLQLSYSVLQTIRHNCKSLVEIGLSKCKGVTDEGVGAIVTDRLQSIDLTCCCAITDDAILAIAKTSKKLLSLGLESCSSITEAGLDRLATCCSSLKELDLTDCNVNDSGLKCLSKCLELVALKLGLCPCISDKGLTCIGSNCKNLRELDFYRCTGIGDLGLASVASGCRRLRKLNICYCGQITDEGFKCLSLLEELSDLEMRNVMKVTGKGLAAVAVGCRRLAKLEMKRCYLVDDMGFLALAQYARNLRQINISYCPVSDVSLCVMLGNLRCLQDVKMEHLTRVSLEGFELGLRASCDRLKKVKLVTGLKNLLSRELMQLLDARGCKIKWVDKPLVLV
ncbi:F-box/LRR-repeat protein 3 [Aristolochia californica]|uniref:F-box/LRR-repeat protein 3 n=1 Tax=Aristolochia californica TaxID=171875 RepID=UPI0035E09B81